MIDSFINKITQVQFNIEDSSTLALTLDPLLPIDFQNIKSTLEMFANSNRIWSFLNKNSNVIINSNLENIQQKIENCQNQFPQKLKESIYNSSINDIKVNSISPVFSNSNHIKVQINESPLIESFFPFYKVNKIEKQNSNSLENESVQHYDNYYIKNDKGISFSVENVFIHHNNNLNYDKNKRLQEFDNKNSGNKTKILQLEKGGFFTGIQSESQNIRITDCDNLGILKNNFESYFKFVCENSLLNDDFNSVFNNLESYFMEISSKMANFKQLKIQNETLKENLVQKQQLIGDVSEQILLIRSQNVSKTFLFIKLNDIFSSNFELARTLQILTTLIVQISRMPILSNQKLILTKFPEKVNNFRLIYLRIQKKLKDLEDKLADRIPVIHFDNLFIENENESIDPSNFLINLNKVTILQTNLVVKSAKNEIKSTKSDVLIKKTSKSSKKNNHYILHQLLKRILKNDSKTLSTEGKLKLKMDSIYEKLWQIKSQITTIKKTVEIPKQNPLKVFAEKEFFVNHLVDKKCVSDESKADENNQNEIENRFLKKISDESLLGNSDSNIREEIEPENGNIEVAEIANSFSSTSKLEKLEFSDNDFSENEININEKESNAFDFRNIPYFDFKKETENKSLISEEESIKSKNELGLKKKIEDLQNQKELINKELENSDKIYNFMLNFMKTRIEQSEKLNFEELSRTTTQIFEKNEEEIVILKNKIKLFKEYLEEKPRNEYDPKINSIDLDESEKQSKMIQVFKIIFRKIHKKVFNKKMEDNQKISELSYLLKDLSKKYFY